MKRAALYGLLVCLGLVVAGLGCASAPKYDKESCPLYTELEPIRVNPAGALSRHLRVEVAFRVCPPGEGLAELQRKRIELKHNLIALLSRKGEEELNHPLRVENLQQEILMTVNREVLKKAQVVEVFITSFELE